MEGRMEARRAAEEALAETGLSVEERNRILARFDSIVENPKRSGC